MKLFEFYQFINKYSCYEDKIFLKKFYEEILCDEEVNPFSNLTPDYRERLYRGQAIISPRHAKKLVNIDHYFFNTFFAGISDSLDGFR